MAEENIVIKIKADVGITKEVIDAVTKAMENLGKTATIVTGNVKVTNKNLEDTNKILGQVAQTATTTGNALNSAGNNVKKSNQQWTNFALILQDLPYGFRGIQNNLPAVIGGFAGMTGPIYLASSAIIAFFTAWDAGIIKFGNSVKLSTDFSKEAAKAYSNETIKLESLYRVATDSNKSMTDRLDAAKELKKEYPGLLGAYSDEAIVLGKAKKSYDELTTTIWKYALAQAATKELEEIASKKLPLMIEKTKLLAKERQLSALENNKALLQGINVYSQYNNPLANIRQRIKDNTNEQKAWNDKAKDYVPIIDANINAEAKLDKFKAKPSKTKTTKADTSLLNSLKSEQALYKDDMFMKRAIGLEVLNEEERLAVEEAKKNKASNETFLNITKDFKFRRLTIEKETLDEIQKVRNEDADRAAKEKEKADKLAEDASNKVNERNLQNSLDALKIQSDVETKILLKGGKSTAADRIKILEDYKSKLYDLASVGGYTADQFDKIDDALIRVDAAIAGSKDQVKSFSVTWTDTINGINQVITSFVNDSMVALGDSIGKALAGENVDVINTFGTLLADALKGIGVQLIAFATASLAAWALLKTNNPVTALAALGAGIAAVAAGAYMKSNLEKDRAQGVKKFANGGVISGPTMGLMGEYPGAKSNPEVVAPLDKLKSMMGGNGGGQFLLRGQDLLLAVNRAQKASNLKGQTISLA